MSQDAAPLHAFDGYGIELEYMIVDRERLSVLPVADRLLQAASAAGDYEVEHGLMGWSNELVLHVEKTDAFDDARLREMLMEHFSAELELHPNRVEFHSIEDIRHKQGVGTLLKEQRVIDNRPKAGSATTGALAEKK